MPVELFRRAAEQTGRISEVVSLHVLGEPLTHPDFPEILSICSRLGLKINLVTNGTLLHKVPASVFKEKCLSQVSVSLHALSSLPAAERPLAVKRLGQFALNKPAELTVSFRLRSGGPDGFFNETLEGLLAAFGRAPEPVSGPIKLAGNVFLNFGEIFAWPGGSGGKAKTGCLGLRHNFGILSDGRVVPCCLDFDGVLALGNIKEKPLEAILGSPEALALKESIAGITPMPAYCATCGFIAPKRHNG
jgi:MoaA/NifB/PqqE/SkfB family radical SAM enzyme